MYFPHCVAPFLKKKKKSVRRFSLSFMNLKKKADSYVGFFLLHLAQKTYSVKPCSITSAKFPSNTDVKRVVLQLLTVPCPRKRVCLIWLGGLIRPVLIYRHRRATDCGVQQLPYQICVVSFICCLSRWQYSVTNVYPQTMNELFIKRKKKHKQYSYDDDYRYLSCIDRSHWLLHVSVLVRKSSFGMEKKSLSRTELCFSPVLLF